MDELCLYELKVYVHFPLYNEVSYWYGDFDEAFLIFLPNTFNCNNVVCIGRSSMLIFRKQRNRRNILNEILSCTSNTEIFHVITIILKVWQSFKLRLTLFTKHRPQS
jgi:hypothetical protein